MISLLTLGLALGVASCSDDDDKELTPEQKEQQAIDQMEVTKQYWTVVGQLAGSDSYTEDYKGKTFAPIIGEATNGNEAVRTIITGDRETAAVRFCGLVGIDSKTFAADKEYVWKNENVGTLTYKPTSGTSLATVDVDIKQMPGLSQLVYKTIEQAGSNGDFKGTAYYRFGDVVKKVEDGQTDYWICVRPAFGPEGKEDSHWVSVSPLHGNYIKEVTKRGVTHRLPVNLYTAEEHMQNLAEVLYAMFKPCDYDSNLSKDYKTLKYFNDFDYLKNYELNSSGFFADQYHNWGNDQMVGGDIPVIFKTVMGIHTGELATNLEYDYGISFIYDVSLKSDGVKMKRRTFYGKNMKTVMEDAFTVQIAEGGFDIANYSSAQANYIKAPGRGDRDVKAFFVRYKTGKELCKGAQPAKYDKRKKLTNCEDVCVYNLRKDLDIDNLRNIEPEKSDRVYRPHYRLGDVYQDEKGNRWFVANMGGSPFERSPYSELISFEGMDVDVNKGYVNNVPKRAQAIRAFCHLWNYYNAVASANGDNFNDISQRPASYLNIRSWADVDIRKLIQRSKAANNDPRQSSMTACIAYYDNNDFDITQPLLRVIINNQNQANDMTFWIWDSYPQAPSADEQFQRVFSDKPLRLQDIANQELVDKYAEDHYARQPLLIPSTIDGKEGPVREPRQQAEPKAKEVSNYFYDRESWNAFRNPTSMWNEPVIFLRMTAVKDLGDNEYSEKTVDGHTLRLLHARDWNIEDDDNLQGLINSLKVYYTTFVGDSFFENGQKSTWPTWRIWRELDPDFKM